MPWQTHRCGICKSFFCDPTPYGIGLLACLFRAADSIDQVQMMTDHARREIVKGYASVQLDEKRRLLEEKGG
jgi:hypothetical protein